MRTIRLNATSWSTREDVYGALLTALGSFEGHGGNLDALWDSITEVIVVPTRHPNLNSIQPPFHIDFLNADTPPSAVRELLAAIADVFQKARAEYGVRVSIALRPSLRI